MGQIYYYTQKSIYDQRRNLFYDDMIETIENCDIFTDSINFFFIPQSDNDIYYEKRVPRSKKSKKSDIYDFMEEICVVL